MATLHMETDTVRALARQFKQAAETLRGQTQALNGSVQSVDWLGPSREEFVADVNGLVRQLESQSEAGMLLAERVETEVTEWETTASTLSGDSGTIRLTPLPIGPIRMPGGPQKPPWLPPDLKPPSSPPEFFPEDPGFHPPFNPTPRNPFPEDPGFHPPFDAPDLHPPWNPDPVSPLQPEFPPRNPDVPFPIDPGFNLPPTSPVPPNFDFFKNDSENSGL